MRFGFLAHPTSPGHRGQVRATIMMRDLWRERRDLDRDAATTVDLPLFDDLRSATGATCGGEIRMLPYTAADLLAATGRAEEIVVAEGRGLIEGGAAIIGLGGATAIVGQHGERIAAALGVAVTSGNSLTAHAALHVLHEVLRRRDDAPGDRPITVVGFPGSIGLVLARMLLAEGHRLNLVHRRSNAQTGYLLRHLPERHHEQVTLCRGVEETVAGSRVFVGASSTGGLIDPAALSPGSVVLDVALPHDVVEGAAPRDDVLLVDAGLVRAGEGVTVGRGRVPAPTEAINGCLAETMVLALDGRAESFSLGRELDPAGVARIAAAAARHGFVPAPPSRAGRPVDLSVLERRGTRSRSARTRERFRRYVNPPLHDLYAAHGLDQVFTRAHGSTLTTEDGTDYLDFVAGYGCLNVGHNHPAVVARLHGFLDAAGPTFVQYVSVPTHAAELAERLCAVAPGDLRRVFLSNSGTEAVEAALKLARAATGRPRIVHTANSFHGKTLGALSVTRRRRTAAMFGPLLPDCVEVPYGDVDALAAALDGAAAFIVEPVQGEGGVVPAPPGYLPAAERLCRRAGAALIVDEIQTGLGRTGPLFACEHEGVRPDVLCVAKSLSGGLVPIGATLATAELWDAAYGTSERSVVHTSTFGGGNLAAAAGMATLDVLAAPGFLDDARSVGDHLRESLRAAAAPYDFVGEVRGVGMMNAIAFDTGFDGAAAALVDEALTRLPGTLRSITDTLPDDVVAALRSTAALTQEALGDLLALRLVSGLRERRMLTYLSANSNRVLRIQPPLVLTRSEADRFVAAFADVCAHHVAQAGPLARPARPAPDPALEQENRP